MLENFLKKITANKPARLIPINGKPYLIRYYMGTVFGFTVYLHQWFNSDGERHVHDHPWRFSVGIPLVGHYKEERQKWMCPKQGSVTKTRTVFRFRPNLITAGDFHRISYIKPGTWTLFSHSKKKIKGWGFLTRPNDHSILFHRDRSDKGTFEWWKKAKTGEEVRGLVHEHLGVGHEVDK